MATCTLVRIVERSGPGEARRRAEAYARDLGFDAETSGRVAIVVTELASNLLKHAVKGGDLFVGAVERDGAAGVAIVAVDKGPGIVDERRVLEDGFSTAGSQGTGLGAIVRLSDSFDLHSLPGEGTIMVSRIWRDPVAGPLQVEVGAVCGMLEGEGISGDDFAVLDLGGRTRIMLADGLGHGPGAAEAATAAVAGFLGAGDVPLDEVMHVLHGSLRPTRGAAVGIAEINPAERVVRYTGLGNIAATLLGEDSSRSLVSNNGTVGHIMSRIQTFSYDIPAAARLVLHSDGITTRWNLANSRRTARRDPTVFAALLYRDFHRARDDATAIVARIS